MLWFKIDVIFSLLDAFSLLFDSNSLYFAPKIDVIVKEVFVSSNKLKQWSKVAVMEASQTSTAWESQNAHLPYMQFRHSWKRHAPAALQIVSLFELTLHSQDSQNMNLRLLPSYTTERYYILSEIEDRADFELLEKIEGSCITVEGVVNCHHLSVTIEKPHKTKP